MTQTDKWIQQTYKDLEARINEQENEFLAMFIGDYLSGFAIDDSTLKNTSLNYNKVNEINEKFDEAYDSFIIPFLLWYGGKLIEAGQISLDYFKSIGIDARSKDIAYLSAIIGLNGNRIVKGSFLWNLGKMGEVRQRLQSIVMNAVSSSQKFNLLVSNTKPIFKSTKKQRSLLSKYYLKHAYNPIMQTLNGVSYKLAMQFGATHFLYAGDLIEKSRTFCIHRAGKTYSIEEGKSWNGIEWNGKIPDVDFFVQVGGWACRHRIEYKINETNKPNDKSEN